jgi:hypothetical protein
MARRNKTKFEKFFSFNRYMRRKNAKKLSSLIDLDFKKQKKIIIQGEKSYTHGSTNNLENHFNSLKYEFTNQSKLTYTHAQLIVLIRREFQTEKHFKLFELLWKKESKFLLKELNTRWLVSAAETFTDYSDNDTEKSIGISSSILINTIKLIETERLITHANKLSDDNTKIELLQTKRISLFDGTSAFTVGTDDTIRNMRWRIDKLSKLSITGKILLEIFKRVQNNDTVYQRFKNRHTRKKTGWW